jgi:hypothetical protein
VGATFKFKEKEKLMAVKFSMDQVKEYLDALRESGETNMFGAGSYLERRFGLNKKEAQDALAMWMRNF